MKTSLQSTPAIRGSIRVPGDKSIAHRSLVLGAIARGDQVIEGLPDSEDVRSTISCLESLGLRLEREEGGRTIVHPEEFVPRASLYAGNSGTTARLIAGLVAGRRVEVSINGDGSLRRRPMDRVAEPLRLMGATIITTPGGRLPMTIRGGRLTGIDYSLPVPSAQAKSAVLIAALTAAGVTTVRERVPTRDHTERLLRAMGAEIRSSDGAVSVEGPTPLEGIRVRIPGDVSSAAFFISAAVCARHSDVSLPGVGVNPTRTGFIEVLREMGARIDASNGTTYLEEPVADLSIRGDRGSTLEGVRVPPERVSLMIDELPLLAVVATQSRGETSVRGAGELRVKESDRISAVVSNLSRMGADITGLDDGFVVRGPSRLRGAAVSSFGDHRIAMAMAVAALLAEGATVIDGSEAAAVSYPNFFSDLERLVVR
jgi:3-phosphoshikimate 1-carboxyvinyltransferase